MEVRDAVEADASALAECGGLPASAAAQLVHDRTVRVVVEDGDDEDETVRGFVAFDAATDAVHVTQLAGDRDAVARLLDEPARFAEREGMPVEVLLPASEDALADAVAAYGFADAGDGPRFEGEATRRFRLEP